jgi:hypothetical protein
MDAVLSLVDMKLSDLKKALDDRQILGTLKSQVDHAYANTGVDINEIEILDDDEVNITILDDLESRIEISPDLDAGVDLHPPMRPGESGRAALNGILPNQDSIRSPIDARLPGDSEITITILDNEGDTHPTQGASNALDVAPQETITIDESEADHKIQLVKSRAADAFNELTNLKARQDEILDSYSQRIRELNTARDQALADIEQQIQAETSTHQAHLQQIQQRLVEESQRDQETQREALQAIEPTRLQTESHLRNIAVFIFGLLSVVWIVGVALGIVLVIQSRWLELGIEAVALFVVSFLAVGGNYLLQRNRSRDRSDTLQIQIQDAGNPLDEAEAEHRQHINQLNSQRALTVTNHEQQQHDVNRDYQSQRNLLIHQIKTIYREVTERVIPRGQELLNNKIIQLAKVFGEWHPNWSDPYWQEFEPATVTPQDMREYHGLRVGTLIYPDPIVEIPGIVNLLEGSAFRHIFMRGGSAQVRANELVACLLRIFASMPVGLVSTLLIDNFEQGRTLAGVAVRLPQGTVGKQGRRGDKGQTIVEPVDIDAQLKSIHERITSINHHMVDYGSIDEYNIRNPETQFPYQVIAISNFPSGFTPQSLQILRDILRNGPRAGICVLASVADITPPTNDFDLDQYLQDAYVLDFDSRNNTMGWNHEGFTDYALQPETQDFAAVLPSILDKICQAVEERPNVILYERIARELPSVWSLSANAGILAPVGLNLGGSVHRLKFERFVAHGLIGGRTGVGKSVLLHDIICGLAYSYHPSELQMYLMDFKGSEFSVYGMHKLPHAAVVAVDCDPELGLRVLEKIEKERQARVLAFAQEEANNYEAYMAKGKRLPRILVIIDEIHQLTLSADNEIQNGVKTVLTNLLKQGGGAGIHVLIGTQSPLSGVLDPPMIQEIAMRACLLASENVSSVVLGSGNQAASGLQRAGEVIYNDQNGIPSGNVMFRSALLTAPKATEITDELTTKATTEGIKPSDAFLYYDGLSVPSLFDNPQIATAIEENEEPPV